MSKENIQRFDFISNISYWEGRVNTSHLVKKFKLSRQASSGILKQYREKYPAYLTYNQSSKAFIATPYFTKTFSQRNKQNTFLSYLRAVSIDITDLQNDAGSFVYEVEAPLRHISPEQVRPILRAIRENKAIDIGYISLSSPDYIDRIIEPHALIFDGLRWHVRAFCHKNQDFRDFNLSRFNGKAEFEGNASQSADKDEKWQNYIELTFEPDHRFNEKQKQVIINDYQMKNGRKSITTRIAMLNYLLKKLHLDSYQSTPEAQQIVLTSDCRRDIQQYLFNH
jgi:hypothetical protein